MAGDRKAPAPVGRGGYPRGMKNELLLTLAFLGGVVAARAETSPAVAIDPAPDTCPCSDGRFQALSPKAKAVAKFWDARRKYRLTANVGGLFLIFSGGQILTPTMREAVEAARQAENDMLRARDEAVKLGGLKVSGTDNDAPVTVTLVKGKDADYIFEVEKK